MATKYHNDHNRAAKKDNTIKKVIPDKITECSIASIISKCKDGKCPNVCSPLEIVSKIAVDIGVPATAAPSQVIKEAKEKTKCDSERCVINSMKNVIGTEKADRVLKTYFKVEGPTGSKLLSNYNIDNSLKQWANIFDHFFAYNFNMRNYAKCRFENGNVYNSPDTLTTIHFADVARDMGKKTAGCVINSDIYQGSGKHWMVLFADTRSPTKWTVEFFNSSGNAPVIEFANWLLQTKEDLEQLPGAPPVEIVKVTNIRHQQSKSECGVYSLFYIWSRLNGVPVEYFKTTPIPDQLMFEFRQHLFDDPLKDKSDHFDWEKYKSVTPIRWETQETN